MRSWVVSRIGWRRLPVLATLCALLLLGACSNREHVPATEVRPSPTVPPNLAPVVSIEGPETVHEGFSATWNISASDPEGDAGDLRVSFGNGSANLVAGFTGRHFAVAHRFATDGLQTLTATATDSAGNATIVTLPIRGIPRKVVFIGGVESESRCHGAMAPGWMRSLVDGADLAGFATFGSEDVLSFSYSGRYCDGGTGANGAEADYRNVDTCEGVADAAGHLRDLIDAAAPSRVNVIGHSMGGLVATYLAGSDPAWTAEHLASIVAFDSPLQGVPRMNLEVLRLAGVDGGCSWNSPSLADLSDGGNRVLAIAAAASAVVPVYTVDATDKDGPFGGIRQAVPGGRTHLDGEAAAFTVGMGHSASWWKEAGDAEDRLAQRMALACGIAVLPSTECSAQRW